MSPEPEICSSTLSWALNPAMSASPLPWMWSALSAGILTLIRGLPCKFRFRPSIEMRSASSSTCVTTCLARSESISRVTWKAPGRTSTSTGPASSIRVKPDRVRDSPARAGRATVQTARARGKRRMSGLRLRKPAISGPHRGARVPGERLEQLVEHGKGRGEAGEPGREQGVGVPAAAPEVLPGALDPVLEAVRPQLGVELDADRTPDPVALGGVRLSAEQGRSGDGLEGIPMPVDRVERLGQPSEER